jgi:carboxypeptidase Taq
LSSDIDSVYQTLLAKYKDIKVLETAQGIIHWDMETYMPPKAVEQRSQQLALLSRIHHKMSTDLQTGKLLDEIQSSQKYDSLGILEKRNIYLIKKGYVEQTSLPEKLVADIARQEVLTVNSWKKAKAQKNFNLLKADLEKLFELSKQTAEILKDVKETKTPYEALIDNFEPKMTVETITNTFNRLLEGLKPLINEIQNAQIKPKTKILYQYVPPETQRQITQLLTQTLGYDTSSTEACGRVDETEHPFTTGCYNDVRITTHYHPDNYTNSIFSVLHETGHALYEQNLNSKWKYQPVGSTCSYGIHESQSRFYENIIGRSKEFWSNFLPKLRHIVSNLANIELDNFIHAINRVEPSKIRIEADEVTYNLHIIIRFEIEKDLFSDKLEIDELPQIWNQKYNDYLGVKVDNDSEGVMQDTHWPSGLYGYFPSYALGNIYSGQLVDSIKKDLPDWNNQLKQGTLTNINSWLEKRIHQFGNLYDPEELIKKVTGKKLDPQAYLQYLRKKYSVLNGF